MMGTHVIHRMSVSLDGLQDHPAYCDENHVLDWVHQHLLPVLERTLDDLFPENTNAIVESIELDLGEWSLQEFENQWITLFEKRLRSVLSKNEEKVPMYIQQCVEVVQTICLPIFAGNDRDAFLQFMESCALRYSRERCCHSGMKIAESMILDIANAFPAVDVRQLTTIAYPKLKQAYFAESEEGINSMLPSRIENAGIVIVAPYLGHLFRMLGLVKDGAFCSEDEAKHAVRLLQYTVYSDGSAEMIPNSLDCILCGLPIDTVFSAAETILPDEKRLVDQMLTSIIQHWSALGSTSIQGLRETFLRHVGKLTQREQTWELIVQNGSFDVLIDRIPWGIQMVKYDWMPKIIHVNWR